MEQKQPFFSVIIPTYNRPQQLANCLKALSRIDYPRDCFEVIRPLAKVFCGIIYGLVILIIL